MENIELPAKPSDGDIRVEPVLLLESETAGLSRSRVAPVPVLVRQCKFGVLSLAQLGAIKHREGSLNLAGLQVASDHQGEAFLDLDLHLAADSLDSLRRNNFRLLHEEVYKGLVGIDDYIDVLLFEPLLDSRSILLCHFAPVLGHGLVDTVLAEGPSRSIQTPGEPVSPLGLHTLLRHVNVLLVELRAFLAVIPGHDLVFEFDLPNGTPLLPTLRDQIDDEILLLVELAGPAGVPPLYTVG